MENKEFKIVFFGTPEFGAIVLRGLADGGYKPIFVVTEPDRSAGRKNILTPPPVKTIAKDLEIPVLQPEKVAGIRTELSDIAPDLGVVAAYGQIIPKEILDIPKHGFINIHPSLLPEYRGPSPIQYAILDGKKETGVTIMLVDEKMDHGPALAVSKWIIKDGATFPELHDELAEIGTKLLLETIPKWISGEIKPVLQDDKTATYTKILKKENGRLDWKKSAEELERQIRAFYPWPGTFTQTQDGKLLKIWKAKTQVQDKNCPVGPPGKTFMATNEEIAVQTGKNFLIIEELQLEGKNRMKSSEFLKGRINFIGTILNQ